MPYDYWLHTTRDRADAVEARMRELGLHDGTVNPGLDRYYGPGVEEQYEINCVRELGEMPDGSFEDPSVAIAARAVADAQHDLMAAESYLGEGLGTQKEVDCAAERVASTVELLAQARADVEMSREEYPKGQLEPRSGGDSREIDDGHDEERRAAEYEAEQE